MLLPTVYEQRDHPPTHGWDPAAPAPCGSFQPLLLGRQPLYLLSTIAVAAVLSLPSPFSFSFSPPRGVSKSEEDLTLYSIAAPFWARTTYNLTGFVPKNGTAVLKGSSRKLGTERSCVDLVHLYTTLIIPSFVMFPFELLLLTWNDG